MTHTWQHCTFCTIANTTVGVLIGVAPVATPLLTGRADLALWGLPLTLLILGYTARRVSHVGFLPGADHIAHATGLSRVVGPGVPEHDDARDTRTDTTATERRQQ